MFLIDHLVMYSNVLLGLIKLKMQKYIRRRALKLWAFSCEKLDLLIDHFCSNYCDNLEKNRGEKKKDVVEGNNSIEVVLSRPIIINTLFYDLIDQLFILAWWIKSLNG